MDRSAEFLRGCLHAIDDLPGMPEHMRLEWINRRIEIYTEWLAAAEAREGGEPTAAKVAEATAELHHIAFGGITGKLASAAEVIEAAEKALLQVGQWDAFTQREKGLMKDALALIGDWKEAHHAK